MAEVVGLTASIIQIAGAGVKLSTALYTYVGSAARADQDISDIAGDVALTANVLDCVGNVFKEDDAKCLVSKKAVQDASSIIQRCESVFREINLLIDKRRKVSKDGKITSSAIGKLIWPMREQRVELLRRRLDSLKTSLLVLLEVLRFAGERSRGKLEQGALEREREKIRLLHQRQQDALKSLEVLESKVGGMSLKDNGESERNARDATIPSAELPTVFFMAAHPELGMKSEEKNSGIEEGQINVDKAPMSPDDLEWSASENETADEHSESEPAPISISDLAKCTQHVKILLKRINALQSSFENSSPGTSKQSRKLHKLYRRFCQKFESDGLKSSAHAIPRHLPPFPPSFNGQPSFPNTAQSSQRDEKDASIAPRIPQIQHQQGPTADPNAVAIYTRNENAFRIQANLEPALPFPTPQFHGYRPPVPVTPVDGKQPQFHGHRLPAGPVDDKQRRPHGPPNVVGHPGMPSPAPRPRGPKLKFRKEDDDLLIELKEKNNLAWNQIADFFPGRTSGTLQMRYCTRLKKRRRSNDDTPIVDNLGESSLRHDVVASTPTKELATIEISKAREKQDNPGQVAVSSPKNTALQNKISVSSPSVQEVQANEPADARNAKDEDSEKETFEHQFPPTAFGSLPAQGYPLHYIFADHKSNDKVQPRAPLQVQQGLQAEDSIVEGQEKRRKGRKPDSDSIHDAKKRRCISSACAPCRKRKSKCDGASPTCSACAKDYNTTCIYEPSTDHRRKGVYKKNSATISYSVVGAVDAALQVALSHSTETPVPMTFPPHADPIAAGTEYKHDSIGEYPDFVGIEWPTTGSTEKNAVVPLSRRDPSPEGISSSHLSIPIRADSIPTHESAKRPLRAFERSPPTQSSLARCARCSDSNMPCDIDTSYPCSHCTDSGEDCARSKRPRLDLQNEDESVIRDAMPFDVGSPTSAPSVSESLLESQLYQYMAGSPHDSSSNEVLSSEKGEEQRKSRSEKRVGRTKGTLRPDQRSQTPNNTQLLVSSVQHPNKRRRTSSLSIDDELWPLAAGDEEKEEEEEEEEEDTAPKPNTHMAIDGVLEAVQMNPMARSPPSPSFLSQEVQEPKREAERDIVDVLLEMWTVPVSA